MVFDDIVKLMIAIYSYLDGLGLRRLEDYVIELSMWVDAEIEGWSKPQIVVKLLENMLKTASELVPRETLTEILISVE